MSDVQTTPAVKADDVPENQPASESDEEKEFEAAFEEFAAPDEDEAASEEAAPTDDKTIEQDPAPDAQAPAAAEAAPEDDAAPDIWADATPEQQAAVTALRHENDSHRTRATAQNRKINELISAPPAAAPAAEPGPKPDDAADEEADKNWEQFQTEYPEVAAPVAERFETRLAKLEAENAVLRGSVNGITDRQTQDAIDTQEAVLLDRHPNYIAETSTPEFTNWLNGQPRYVQEGFVRNGKVVVDGQEAASLLDLYRGNSKAAPSEAPASEPPTGKTTRRQRRLQSAVQTEGGQAGPGAGPPNDDFDAAFEHFARDKPVQ